MGMILWLIWSINPWTNSRLLLPPGSGWWMSCRFVSIYPTHVDRNKANKTVKYVPSWFPGAEFKRKAKAWNKNVQDTIDVPYAFVQEQMKKGKYEPSYLSSLLEDGLPAKDSEEEIVIKNSAMSLYAGGADTVISPFLRRYIANLF